MNAAVEEFLSSLPFAADPFQIESIEAVARGDNVVVTAPTGAGKTLIADFAVYLSLRRGTRTFYTTPIKALSNQKYTDLVTAHGGETVGLLTGDNVINPRAPIVVMTTEVLRNMIYADPEALDAVDFVILDEVHYLQDPFRGAVWEEVIIHAPSHTRLVCLSATIANADEFAAWVGERRGDTTLVVAHERPVPLESLYMLADRVGTDRIRLLPMFTGDTRRRPNPRLVRLLSMERGRRRRFSTPRRIEVVETLAEEGMLPAIYFIFSRAGCDSAALTVVQAGLRLTDAEERKRIREVAERRTAHLGDDDLAALEYGRWITTLEAGVAAHHAGMVPAFKETVEELFIAGLLKVVFATETLSLGINMPARTVVLESLSKFDGESHSLLEPGDYTQLTGRAGRRGIDTVGYGVVLHSRYVPFDQVTRIASVGSHPLRSSFRPTYNMAANLVANYTEEEAMGLLTASFAQFQAEGDRESDDRLIAELEERLQDELRRAECDLGPVEEYAAQLEARHPRARLAGVLHPGDVVDIPAGPRAGRFVVVRKLGRGKRGPRLLAVGTSGRTTSLSDRELVPGTTRVGTLDLPGPYRGGDRRYTQRLIDAMKNLPAPKPVDVPEHPVARCPRAESHVRWLKRARRTEKRLAQLRTRRAARGQGLVEEFSSIYRLLEEWGYLEGWRLTPRGERLRFVYNELDLLLVEAVEQGILWGLEPAELAALASCFVYEPRTDHPAEPPWPNQRLQERYRRLIELWETLVADERRHRLDPTRRPEAGFVPVAYAWAGMRRLDQLPGGKGLQPGDFVRVARQLVDLLRQLRDTFDELSDEAEQALRAVDRGVVAAMGVA